MNLTKQEKLAQYIQKELNKYKKPQNKNEDFINQLMEKAEANPSRLWAIYSPTQKLRHDFVVIENKLMAKKYADHFINKTSVDSLRTIATLCYSSCRIIDGKSSNKLDEKTLEQWRNAFKPVLSEFNVEIDKVMQELNEFTNKKPEEQNKQLVDKLSSTQISNKPKI